MRMRCGQRERRHRQGDRPNTRANKPSTDRQSEKQSRAERRPPRSVAGLPSSPPPLSRVHSSSHLPHCTAAAAPRTDFAHPDVRHSEHGCVGAWVVGRWWGYVVGLHVHVSPSGERALGPGLPPGRRRGPATPTPRKPYLLPPPVLPSRGCTEDSDLYVKRRKSKQCETTARYDIRRATKRRATMLTHSCA